MSMNLDKKEFMDYLKYQKHYSVLTIAAYERNINEFIDYLKRENITSFQDVQYPLIRGYLTALFQKKYQKVQLIIK